MLKIGSHIGMSGKEMFLGSAKEAVAFGETAFMIYTGAPQNTRRKAIEELNIQDGNISMPTAYRILLSMRLILSTWPTALSRKRIPLL